MSRLTRRKVSITNLVAALRSRAKLDASQCLEDRVCVGEIIDRMTNSELEAFATKRVLPKWISRTSAMDAVRAAIALAKLNAGGQAAADIRTRFDQMTDTELESYIETGGLPKCFSRMEEEL